MPFFLLKRKKREKKRRGLETRQRLVKISPSICTRSRNSDRRSNTDRTRFQCLHFKHSSCAPLIRFNFRSPRGCHWQTVPGRYAITGLAVNERDPRKQVTKTNLRKGNIISYQFLQLPSLSIMYPDRLPGCLVQVVVRVFILGPRPGEARETHF
jgi:hypothetical protein